MGTQDGRKFHYAWVIFGCGILLMLINMGFSQNLVSFLMAYLREEFDLTGAQTANMLTARNIAYAAGIFIANWYFDKVGLRKGLAITVMFSAVHYLLYATGSYGIFLAASVFGGLARGIGSIFGVAVLVNKWFVKYRGMALGVTSAGSGLSTFIFPPVIEGMINSIGLRNSFYIEAASIAVFAVILYIFLRDDPSDMGLQPYGVAEGYVPSVKKDVPAGKKVGGLCFVVLIFGIVARACAGNGSSNHLSLLVTTNGFATSVAATATSVYGFTLMLGKSFFGIIADKIGTRRTIFIFDVLLISLLFIMTPMFVNGNEWVPYIFAGMFGLFVGSGALINPMLAGDFSKPEDYSKMLKLLQFVNGVSSIVFAMVPGRIFDATGEYRSSYILCGILYCIALASILFAYAYLKKDSKKEKAA